ncbi:MAG: protein kinase [Bryobacterales bacterium]|nr:protein kinase [Bryobacterales bacterium]
MHFQVGQRVGDYEIVQVLGAGGMGKVYKVRNTISDRFEAMKVLLPDLAGDADLADRFLREIKVQASLSHPNIANLHTALRHENQLLMLMEFVEGSSIESLLGKGPMPLDQAVGYTIQVLDALGYAHGKGVVHRDIKPANMMVTPSGEVKLMDFGIARMKADKRLTQTGRTLGSLYYMSPEQIRGEKELDARSDIYSLGIALYEIVTGKRPFDADSDFSIMAAHLNAPPTPPVEIDPRLPPQFSEIIMMALAKDPAGRFQSAAAFRAALQSVGNAIGKTAIATSVVPPSPVAKPAPLPSLPAPARSARGLYMAIGSLVTVAVLVIAAIQIPKFFSTKAEQTQQQKEPGYKPAVELAPVPQATPSPADTAGSNPNPVSAEPPVQTQQARPDHGRPSQSVSLAVSQAQHAATPQVQPAPIHAPVPTTAAEPVPTVTRVPPPQEPARPAAVPAADPAELDSIRQSLMLLGTRAATVQAKAKRIEQEQRAQGLGMRSDVVSGISRMGFFLDEAESALKSGNAASAKTALQRADRETSVLERILGI